MTVHWSHGSPDLSIAFERGAGSIGSQLQDQLREAIRDGRLGPGERLPSTRRLADSLAVGRGTVVEAYAQLIAEGYVESVVGSGTRVAVMLVAPSAGDRADGAVAVAHQPASRFAGIDFEYGIPDLGSVPLSDWSWAVAEATRTLPTAELGDEDMAGSRHLREVVTAYHRRVRSGCATADDAVIVAGFRQGLNFTLAALARHGLQRIGLENPGPRDQGLLARRAGLEPVPVAVDEHGLNVRSLRDSGARAVLCTPAHQCPTGVALGPARRRELVAWAEDVDGVVIEDDYDAEFRYDRQPVGSLQGLDPSRVIALGSVSKTLAPTIRLGWVLAPRRFLGAIVDEKRLGSRGVPGLDQEALALLMKTGRFDRHLRRARDVYRSRRDVLKDEVELAFGRHRLLGLEAGCHAVLRLPDGSDEGEVARTAAALGVRVNPLGHYRFERADGSSDPLPHPPSLVLGFGNVDQERIRRGVRLLAEAAGR